MAWGAAGAGTGATTICSGSARPVTRFHSLARNEGLAAEAAGLTVTGAGGTAAAGGATTGAGVSCTIPRTTASCFGFAFSAAAAAAYGVSMAGDSARS